METKVFKSIFFVLILLISKGGMALNVHYCGGQISEISMAWDAEGCQVKTFLDQRGFEVRKSHCCNDEIVYIQNNTPEISFVLSYDPDLLILPDDKQVLIFVKKFYLNQKKYRSPIFSFLKVKSFFLIVPLFFMVN